MKDAINKQLELGNIVLLSNLGEHNLKPFDPRSVQSKMKQRLTLVL